jgi:hypothetical protein
MSPKGNAAIREALKSLGEKLRDPKFRDDFVGNYSNALRKNDIDENAVPRATLASLRGMDERELRAVANLNISMTTDGIEESLRAEMV